MAITLKHTVDGDYLAWKDMNWTLHGEVVFETADLEETCIGKPEVVVFPALMNHLSCMRLCENLGSQSPSIITTKEWLSVKDFFQRYDALFIWVAMSDEEKEGEWRDP